MSIKNYLSFLFCGLLFTGSRALAQEPAFKVIGYFPGWADMNKDIDSLDFKKLTHINWAFINPDTTGNFRGNNRGMEKLVTRAHAENVKVLVSLGGGSASGNMRFNYFKLIATPGARASFIHNISDFLKRNKLQGIDVDLEGPAINKDYDAFIRQLCDTLRPQKMLVTAALNGDASDRFSDSTIPLFDWINIMSYDATGAWTPNNPGQHASYEYAQRGLDKWAKRGARRDQLIVGVPFYGHAFRDLIKMDYKNYNEIIKVYPDAYSKDELGDIFYHNGIPTIQKKTKLAMDQAAGIMIWALSYDTYDQYSLLKAIDDTVKAYKKQ
ncbi:glycosyl hydrolase family 18 protein [Hufsiella ginkgonis]|uniref:chitinase n=1 Tax=Hufsiella ginkgonis TaxID=2695274 RepID=A0A7K1XZK3_9SPHI|nr:glycosyl hydrolase family 18 protein [Hufsiella ginkgonis]MXV16441.1 glycoside hydrolase [Hufsiella ginkgonis]